MTRVLTISASAFLVITGLTACEPSSYTFFDPVEGGVNTGGIGGTSKTFNCENIIRYENFETDMVCSHNAVRETLPDPQQPIPDPPLKPLEWSAELARQAQYHAEDCRYEYSSEIERLTSQKGEEWLRASENISAWYSGQMIDWDVVGQWVKGAVNYTYSSNYCQGGDAVCEPYKQVVWADTYEVGCGKATCSTLEGMPDNLEYDFWVCQYRHRGNIEGEWPYETSQ